MHDAAFLCDHRNRESLGPEQMYSLCGPRLTDQAETNCFFATGQAPTSDDDCHA